MSKIEEMTVEQTDEVVGGTSESNTKRTTERGAQSMDMNTNKTQYHVPDYSSKRLEI